MLEENANPNTNIQVYEGQCPPAGQPLTQRKRPQPANGQSTPTQLGDKKRRRQAALANYSNKNSKVYLNRALKSNTYAALGDLGTDEGKNGKPRTEKNMTDLIILLLSHVRLDNGTQFTVDPANNYEITKVRDPRAFFWHGRA
jgi:hypothetical protein